MEWVDYIELNERLSDEWSDYVINEAKDALPEVDSWSGRVNKRDHLIESWDEAEDAIK
jgi:ferredoxin